MIRGRNSLAAQPCCGYLRRKWGKKQGGSKEENRIRKEGKKWRAKEGKRGRWEKEKRTHLDNVVPTLSKEKRGGLPFNPDFYLLFPPL